MGAMLASPNLSTVLLISLRAGKDDFSSLSFDCSLQDWTGYPALANTLSCRSFPDGFYLISMADSLQRVASLPILDFVYDLGSLFILCKV
jgi:hypothetical protein